MRSLRGLFGIGMLTKEEKELLKELQGYGLSDRVYDYYRNNVRNNKNDDIKTAKAKIIRNIVLGKEAPSDRKNPHRRLFYYGNLSVMINTLEEEIVWMQNTIGNRHNEWNVSKDKKEYIEKLLKIS